MGFSEKRRKHLSRKKKITKSKVTWIKKWLSQRTIPFTIFELKTAINQAHNESPVSYMTVFRYLKGDLNFIFKKFDQN